MGERVVEGDNDTVGDVVTSDVKDFEIVGERVPLGSSETVSDCVNEPDDVWDGSALGVRLTVMLNEWEGLGVGGGVIVWESEPDSLCEGVVEAWGVELKEMERDKLVLEIIGDVNFVRVSVAKLDVDSVGVGCPDSDASVSDELSVFEMLLLSEPDDAGDAVTDGLLEEVGLAVTVDSRELVSEGLSSLLGDIEIVGSSLNVIE